MIFLTAACLILYAYLYLTKIDTPEEYVDYLRFINCYSTDIEYRVFNDKGKFQERATLLYAKDRGYKLTLGEDRVYIYNNDEITVKDLINGRSYILKSTFDEFYKWAFLKNYVELIYTNEEVKIYSENKEGKNYLFIELYIPEGNKNIEKGILIIDTETKAPEKLSIYDFKGNLKAEITYANFKFEKDLDKALFDY